MRPALIALLLAATPALSIKSSRARLMKAPSTFSDVVADLPEGCPIVEIERPRGPWARVRADCFRKEGYLPRASYAGLDLSGVARAGPGVVADERTASLASRGFSKEVEAEHLRARQDDATLIRAYGDLDRYEKADDADRPALRDFAAEGQLLGEGGR